MADEATLEEAPASEDTKKRGMLIPLLATGVGSALVAAAIAIGVMTVMGPGAEDGKASADAAAAEAGEPLPTGADSLSSVEVVPLKKFVANLKDGSGGRKISLDISLEGESVDGTTSLADGVALKEAAIRDTVNFLLMDFTYAELRGTDGMLRLRDELHRRIDKILEEANVKVNRVYFTDAVVQ